MLGSTSPFHSGIVCSNQEPAEYYPLRHQTSQSLHSGIVCCNPLCNGWSLPGLNCLNPFIQESSAATQAREYGRTVVTTKSQSLHSGIVCCNTVKNNVLHHLGYVSQSLHSGIVCCNADKLAQSTLALSKSQSLHSGIVCCNRKNPPIRVLTFRRARRGKVRNTIFCRKTCTICEKFQASSV